MNLPSRLRLLTVFSYWPTLLLVGFGSAFLPLAPMLGYRWSIELTLAIFLLAVTLPTSISGGVLSDPPFSFRERELILLPISLFIVWSFVSAVWSTSWRGALHHSLLWSCYLGFFLTARSAVRNAYARGLMLKVVGAVVLAIGLACVLEFMTRDQVAARAFNERYYSYAEVMITLLPIFVACGIFADRKWARLALLVSVFSWASVLATTSRAMFISGIVGLAIFVLLTLLIHKEFSNRKRWILAVLSLTLVTVVFLLPLRSKDQPTVVERLSGNEEFSAKSAQSRLLLWGLAVEGFQNQPLTGIGADNFFTEYKTLRESLSADDGNNTILEMNEELIPERAHSEYLQILAELGLVGGVFFGWLLVAIVYMFWLAYKKRASLLTIGALSGMGAFLVASGVSSYSFRFPTNGICFFFLLAVASRELFGSDEQKVKHAGYRVKIIPVAVGVVSVAMIAFSVVRATSIWHLTNAINAKDESVRNAEIQNAINIDPFEPMFHFYLGQWLYQSGDLNAAITHLRLALDNGFADSTSFYRLATAEKNAGRPGDAQLTFVEGLRIYPRSVFLRTAYAAFLTQIGDMTAAESEHNTAFEINEKQARSWRIAHEEGLLRLVQTARTDDRYASPFDLKPESGVLAVDASQRRLSPK